MARVIYKVSKKRKKAIKYITEVKNIPNHDSCFSGYSWFNPNEKEFYFGYFYPVDLIYTVIEQVNNKFSGIEVIIETVKDFYELRKEKVSCYGIKIVKEYLEEEQEDSVHTQLVVLSVKVSNDYSDKSKWVLKQVLAQFIRMLGYDYKNIFEPKVKYPTEKEIKKDAVKAIIDLTNLLTERSICIYGNWCQKGASLEEFLYLENYTAMDKLTAGFSSNYRPDISSLFKCIRNHMAKESKKNE